MRACAMRKIVTFVGLTLSALLLTSCVKMDISLTVNNDTTVSGYTIFAIDKSLAAMSDAASADSSPTDDLFNSDAKGVTVSEYSDSTFTGKKYTFDRVPFSEFSKGSTSGDSLKFTREGNQISVIGALDFSSADTGASGDPYTDALTASMMAKSELDMSITFPGKVVKSTGTISKDGHTVSWKPVIGKKLDLSTTVELPSSALPIPIIGGLVALVCLGGSLIYLLSRKKNDAVIDEVVEEA